MSILIIVYRTILVAALALKECRFSNGKDQDQLTLQDPKSQNQNLILNNLFHLQAKMLQKHTLKEVKTQSYQQPQPQDQTKLRCISPKGLRFQLWVTKEWLCQLLSPLSDNSQECILLQQSQRQPWWLNHWLNNMTLFFEAQLVLIHSKIILYLRTISQISTDQSAPSWIIMVGKVQSCSTPIILKVNNSFTIILHLSSLIDQARPIERMTLS